MGESAIVGWKAIADLFGVSERKAQRWRKELVKSGFVFYMWVGNPPHRCACGFPSRLMDWAAVKGGKYRETL